MCQHCQCSHLLEAQLGQVGQQAFEVGQGPGAVGGAPYQDNPQGTVSGA